MLCSLMKNDYLCTSNLKIVAYDIEQIKDIKEKAFAYILAFRNFAKIKEASRVKVEHSRHWRGLLLVYDAMVFGDTSESVDEVISPRFFLSPSDLGLS